MRSARRRHGARWRPPRMLALVLAPLAIATGFVAAGPAHPAAAAVSWTLPSDFVGENSVVLTGTKDAGSTLEIRRANASGVVCVVDDPDATTWTCPRLSMANGINEFTGTETLADATTQPIPTLTLRVAGPPTVSVGEGGRIVISGNDVNGSVSHTVRNTDGICVLLRWDTLGIGDPTGAAVTCVVNLYNITGSSSLTLLETSEAAEIIRAAVDEDAEIIYGTSIDESIGDAVMITLIATGFEDRHALAEMPPRRAATGRQQPPPPRDRGVYRISQPEPPARSAQSHNAPILPDDDWDGEASIIRFLRER